MTPQEFLAWLDGYVLDKDKVSVDEIRKKLLTVDEIQPQPITILPTQPLPYAPTPHWGGPVYVEPGTIPCGGYRVTC